MSLLLDQDSPLRTSSPGQPPALRTPTGLQFPTASKLELHEPTDLSPETKKVLGWADKHRKLGVYANADTPTDAQRARNFGAEGIGLCRTEHMFMEKDRLPVVQEMIMIASAAETGARQLRKIEASLDGVNVESRQYRDAQEEIARVKAKMDAPWKKYSELLAKLAPFQRVSQAVWNLSR